MKNKKELKVIIGIVLVVLFIAGLSYFIPKLLAKPSQKLRVLKNGEILLEHDIKKDAKFMILDQEAKEVPFEESLSSLSDDERNPAMHEVNFIEVKDGKVLCTESNCNNQICVHTPAISKENADLPIVCLPHGLILQIVS